MARVARRAKSTTFVPDNITRVYFAERYGEAREGGGEKESLRSSSVTETKPKVRPRSMRGGGRA